VDTRIGAQLPKKIDIYFLSSLKLLALDLIGHRMS